MKKHIFVWFIGLSLFFLGSAAWREARGQSEMKTRFKKASFSPQTRALIEQLARRKISALVQNRVLGDPCDESAPINFDQPLNGTLATGDCRLPDDQLIDFYSFSGSAGQALSIDLNSAGIDTYLYLFDPAGNLVREDDDGGIGFNSRIPDFGGEIILPLTGTYLIGASSAEPETGNYTVRLNSTVRCQPANIAPNQAIDGNITGEDCIVNIDGEFYFKDLYRFQGSAGQQVSIRMNSTAVDAHLILHTPSGADRQQNDNNGTVTDARIPVGSGTITLNQTGIYTIEAGTSMSGEGGNYSLVVDASAAPPRAPFDFDGDGRTDISIFRPSTGEWWFSNSSDKQVRALPFGTATDKPAAADYTGDGRTDFAFWRAATGEWFILRSEDGTFFSFPFGLAGDLPFPADYDGDGRADAAVFRPSNATWFIQSSVDGGTSIIQFGTDGDQPVTGDYDGDGKADLAVFRANGASGAEWWHRRSLDGETRAVVFGTGTDKAVPGDYTGDGKTDQTFFRPATGEWFVLRSEGTGFYAIPFGLPGDVPVPGDYDGDGRTDASVFRPSSGIWFVQRTTAGTFITGFGLASDLPVASALLSSGLAK